MKLTVSIFVLLYHHQSEAYTTYVSNDAKRNNFWLNFET